MNETLYNSKDAKTSKPNLLLESGISQSEPDSTLDDIDRKIVQLLQGDFPLVPRPWREIGYRLGINEEEVVTRVRRLYNAGVVRKIGPIVEGSKIGLSAATLVALKVPKDRVDAVASIINQHFNVSHNYEREHDYNIWFTLAASTRQEIENTLSGITQKAGLNSTDVLNLPTKQRFKINVQFQLTNNR